MKDRQASPIGLEELSAYVDGELDSGRRAVVERHLSDHGEAAGRVSAYRRQDDYLRQALAPLADEGVTEPLAIAQQRRARDDRASRWRMAAAAALLLLVVGAGTWWYQTERAGERRMAELVHEAVTAHVAYLSSSGAVNLRSERSKLAEALRQVAGARAVLPDLTPLGYELTGGMPLDESAGPAVLLVYRNRSGEVVTCYFGRNGSSEKTSYAVNVEASYAVKESHGINVVSQLEGGIGYAVTGHVPSDELMKIAKMGYRTISG